MDENIKTAVDCGELKKIDKIKNYLLCIIFLLIYICIIELMVQSFFIYLS